MRATASLTAKLERSLLAYATAASAAGVGVLALSQAADAKVVYTAVHKVIPPRSDCYIDLNHDGRADFRIYNLQSSTSDFVTSVLYEIPLRGNAAVVRESQHHVTVARALKKGKAVGPRKTFQSQTAPMVGPWDQTTYGSSGSWVNVKNRYLGLKFQINGETHFGWARLSVEVDLYVNITATLTGYAYETVPDKAIITGNRGSTTGAGSDVPTEPASLGRLSLGASGRTQRWRSLPTGN